MSDKKLFRRADIIIIAFFCVLGFALLIPNLINKDNLKAVITVSGEVKYDIDLNSVKESYTINPVAEPQTEITVEKGRICFSSAECPDKLCVNTGWLDSNGQTAACLPAKIVITIKGSGKAPDMITY